MKKKICILSVLTVCVLAAVASLTSCNVTRTVSTTSQYYQRGDTSVVLQTRTIESYDGVKK